VDIPDSLRITVIITEHTFDSRKGYVPEPTVFPLDAPPDPYGLEAAVTV